MVCLFFKNCYLPNSVFEYSCFVKPRDWVTWKVCHPQVTPVQVLSDYLINQAMLSGPFSYSPDPTSSTCRSPSPIPASSPVPQSSSPTWIGSPLSTIDDLDDIFPEKETISPSLLGDNINVIDTNFDLDLVGNISSPISPRASHEEKFEFTEEQRRLAKNAVIPTSLMDLRGKVSNNFFASLVWSILIYLKLVKQLQSGKRLNPSDFIRIPSSLLNGSVLFSLTTAWFNCGLDQETSQDKRQTWKHAGYHWSYNASTHAAHFSW